jgi:hypothetical protein
MQMSIVSTLETEPGQMEQEEEKLPGSAQAHLKSKSAYKTPY